MWNEIRSSRSWTPLVLGVGRLGILGLLFTMNRTITQQIEAQQKNQIQTTHRIHLNGEEIRQVSQAQTLDRQKFGREHADLTARHDELSKKASELTKEIEAARLPVDQLSKGVEKVEEGQSRHEQVLVEKLHRLEAQLTRTERQLNELRTTTSYQRIAAIVRDMLPPPEPFLGFKLVESTPPRFDAFFGGLLKSK